MFNKNIFFYQKKILLFVRNYIKQLNGKINVANSAACYFHNYGDYISSSLLKKEFIGTSYYIRFFVNLLKNFYSVKNTENFICIKNKKIKNYDYLIISHVSKSDFQKDGSYKDKYFNLNSRNYKNTLFFVNSLDGYSPKKLQANIIIFKNKSKGSLSYLLKHFIKFIIQNNFSFQKIFHYFNFSSEFSNKIFPYLYETVNKNKFKKIIMFYEAQPYQNNFIDKLNKKKNIEVIGFYHTGLLPLHTSLIYRQGAPNKLLISGEYQKKYCEKNLGWPKNRVINVESFRYTKNNLLTKDNMIYLPYEISRPNIILSSLKVFFNNAKNKSLPHFYIKNHPVAKNSRKHLNLIKGIKRIIEDNKKKFSKNSKKKSIFIGSTTSIILALEQKKEVIHICEEPIFDSYNEIFWYNLDVERLDQHVFKYKLKTNKHILKLPKKNKNLLDKYF